MYNASAQLLYYFLFVAGVLLVTGATIAGVIHSTRRGVLDTGRRLRDSTSELGGALSRRREPADAGPAPAGEPLCPPEPSGELVVRATHVEAPSLDTGEHPVEESDPDGRPEPAPDQATMASEPPAGTEQAGVMHAGDPPRRPEAGPEDLTPQGRYRDSITEDPEFEWRVPDPSFLKRSTADGARPDTTGQEAV